MTIVKDIVCYLLNFPNSYIIFLALDCLSHVVRSSNGNFLCSEKLFHIIIIRSFKARYFLKHYNTFLMTFLKPSEWENLFKGCLYNTWSHQILRFSAIIASLHYRTFPFHISHPPHSLLICQQLRQQPRFFSSCKQMVILHTIVYLCHRRK